MRRQRSAQLDSFGSNVAMAFRVCSVTMPLERIQLAELGDPGALTPPKPGHSHHDMENNEFPY